MITMQTKNWISCVLLLTSSIWSAQLSATVKMMSDDESAAFDKECAASAKCTEEMSKLRARIAKNQAELDALCKKDAAACARQKAKNDRQFLEHAAECGDIKIECVPQINEAMEAFEQSQLESAWCRSNAVECSALKATRESRKKAGRSWCDDNSDICAKSKTEHAKQKHEWDLKELAREKQQQEAAKRQRAQEVALREKSKKDADAQRATLLKEFEAKRDEYQSEADRKFISEEFKCVQDEHLCFEQINMFTANQEQTRQTERCAKNPKQCAPKKNAAKKPVEQKPWCERYREDCKRAHQRFVQNLNAAS